MYEDIKRFLKGKDPTFTEELEKIQEQNINNRDDVI